MDFKGKSPCGNCPYRKDAPLRLWDKEEFIDLMVNDKDLFGKVYYCHKQDNTVCKGFLINQDKRNFPSLALRMSLTKYKVTREYLDKLSVNVEMYKSIEQMSYANYPELKCR